MDNIFDKYRKSLTKRNKYTTITFMELITEKYKTKILGVVGCFDRVLIKGGLPHVNYPEGMEKFLYHHNVRLFDYTEYAQSFRDKMRAHTENLAKSHDLKIINVDRRGMRKEDVVASELKKREEENVKGLFCIISAMEGCPGYKPQYDKENNRPYLKYKERQCIHYYFYFMDKYLGLCFVRVPTWLPFRIEVYFNGHNWLANRLKQEGIEYVMLDNAFSYIADFEKAQEISDNFNVKKLHELLDQFAQTYCPIHKYFDDSYHWSVMQVEYATDIIFAKQKDLQKIYNDLVTTAMHTVKPENIATFLSRKLHTNYKGEMGNRYDVRKEGIRLKHAMGKVSIKMYDKFQLILRIETTSNDISFFQHYRKVEHKDGTTSLKFTSMRKYIYSLKAVIKIMKASNKRYIEFVSSIESKHIGIKRLDKVSKRVEENKRGYKGINFFEKEDTQIIQILSRGEFNISGFRNKDIRGYLTNKTSSQVSRLLKRLKLHGLIKKARNSYKYYLTRLGKEVSLTAMKIREFIMIPDLNY